MGIYQEKMYNHRLSIRMHSNEYNALHPRKDNGFLEKENLLWQVSCRGGNPVIGNPYLYTIDHDFYFNRFTKSTLKEMARQLCFYSDGGGQKGILGEASAVISTDIKLTSREVSQNYLGFGEPEEILARGLEYDHAYLIAQQDYLKGHALLLYSPGASYAERKPLNDTTSHYLLSLSGGLNMYGKRQAFSLDTNEIQTDNGLAKLMTMVCEFVMAKTKFPPNRYDAEFRMKILSDLEAILKDSK